MEQVRPSTVLSWTVTMDTTAKRPVLAEGEKRVSAGTGCPLRSSHSTSGSGNQPAEVHSARMLLSWVSVTWRTGDEPSPEGRTSAQTL